MKEIMSDDEKNKNKPEDLYLFNSDDSTALALYERNTLILPLFFPDKKRAGSREIIEKTWVTPRGTAVWRVSPNVVYGAGGPFDDAVFSAILQYLTPMQKPIKNPIKIRSLLELYDLIYSKESSYGGNNIGDIKQSLRRMKSLLITTQHIFFNKAKKEYLGGKEGLFNILDKVIFKDDITDTGDVATETLIWLNDTFLSNINSRYAVLIDIDFYKKLNPTGKAIFKQLIVSFFANRNNKSPVRYRYSTIIDRILLQRQRFRSRADQQLSPALNDLVEKTFLAAFRWDAIKGEKDDWYLTFWPGALAEQHFKAYAKDHQESAEDTIIRQSSINFNDIPENIEKVNKDKIDKIVDYYKKEFKQKFNNYPHVTPKDTPIISELLVAYGDNVLKKLIKAYMEQDDPFIVKTGYTIPVLRSQIQKLLIILQNNARQQSHKAPQPDASELISAEEVSEFVTKIFKY